MNRKTILTVTASALAGAMLLGPAANAATEYFKATRSNQDFFLNGQQIEMEAYMINGNNYVKLRDIGEAVGFNIYWDGAVQIRNEDPYTGVAL